MDVVKRGEVLQAQARINTAAAFAIVFAIDTIFAIATRLIQTTKSDY
jgi:hypothetical protein